MAGGSAAAPTPSPAIGNSADRQAALGEEWLKFSKDQFAISQTRQTEIDALTKSISEQQLKLAQDQGAYAKTQTDRQLAIAEEQLGLSKSVAAKQLESATWQDNIAREDRQRYEDIYRPIEDDFINEASTYGSEQRQDAAAAEAMADVQSAAASSRAAAGRQAMSVGINPNSGRFAGIDRAGELGTSLAVAGAANNARTATRDKGLSLKADLANLGRGVSSAALQTAAGATGTQNSALNVAGSGRQGVIGAIDSAIGTSGATAASTSNALSTGLAGKLNANSQFLGSTGIVGQGYSGANQGYANQSATLSNLYNADMSAYQNQQQQSSNNFGAVAGAIGTGVGLFLSDEDLKEDKAEIADGDALEAVNAMPVESWRYKDGVADEGEHVGPYAQDFQEQTGKGDGHSIPAQDAIGISMRAIQDLDKKVDKIARAVGIGGPMRPQRKAKPGAGRTVPPPADEPAPAPMPPSRNPMPPVGAAPGIGIARAA